MPQPKKISQKRFQSILSLAVVKLVIDNLCINLFTKKRPKRPTAKDNSIKNRLRLGSKSPIKVLSSKPNIFKPWFLASSNAAMVNGI